MSTYLVQWKPASALAHHTPHTLVIQCTPEFAAQRAYDAAQQAAGGRRFAVLDVQPAPEVGDPVKVVALAPHGQPHTVEGTLAAIYPPETSAAGGTFRRVIVAPTLVPEELADFWSVDRTVTMAQAQAWPAAS